MKTNRTNPVPRAGGFTLTELLVVIILVVGLAALAIMGTKRALHAARVAADINNLRNCGTVLIAYAADVGYFPPGYNWSSGQSWADVILEEQVGEESKVTQSEMFQSPLLERNIPAAIETGAVLHFSGNPYIFSDSGAPDPNTGIAMPKWPVRLSNLMRPNEQFLVCSAPPQYEAMAYKACHPIMWAMRNLAGGGYPANSIPQSDEDLANRSIRLSPKLAEQQQYNDLPDFFRYGNGKGQFLFADGHVAPMAPSDMKQKHLAVSY
ncbi:MAG: type II secretion system protein [Akkermansiaceae bacterium]|nr:type II secretion system protein [Akkermansiaceae bacterium]